MLARLRPARPATSTAPPPAKWRPLLIAEVATNSVSMPLHMQRIMLPLVLSTITAATSCAGTQPPGTPTVTQAQQPTPADAPPAPTVTEEDARQFLDDVDRGLREHMSELEHAAWVKSTYITEDTELLETKAQARFMEYLTDRIRASARFDSLDLPTDLRRKLHLLRFYSDLPAPSDPALREEFAGIISQLDSMYGKGRYCSAKLRGHALPKGMSAKKDDGCRSLNELSDILAESKDYDILLEAWQGWRTISRPMRPLYQRFVELGNQGARELGFENMAAIWQGHYDMPAADFIAEMNRLETQLKPLYEQLHCYVRRKLGERYGTERVPQDGPIPAHLLGNMWAQEWTHLYKLVEPYPGHGQPDVTRSLLNKKYDHLKMVRLAEGFFTSLGLNPLPETFWQRSMFVKPEDRDVICHASAWDVGMRGDLRIKMCIDIDYENLVTIHHELGHDYYFMYYGDLPVLYQQGANDGFHEGIGDTLALAVTPSYLKQVGLADKIKEDEQADINLLMQRALEGVAFLPFGRMIDQWRWDIFNGKVPASDYNAHWWKLRQTYQGIAAPIARDAEAFDPGAKYHIPGNTPYIRYYLARVLQYQFLRALCREAGHEGPLHRCSFYGSQAAGDKLKAMLKLGASRPWPDALQALSGERSMDASAMVDYYAPLMTWLQEKNAGQTCGW